MSEYGLAPNYMNIIEDSTFTIICRYVLDPTYIEDSSKDKYTKESTIIINCSVKFIDMKLDLDINTKKLIIIGNNNNHCINTIDILSSPYTTMLKGKKEIINTIDILKSPCTTVLNENKEIINTVSKNIYKIKTKINNYLPSINTIYNNINNVLTITKGQIDILFPTEITNTSINSTELPLWLDRNILKPEYYSSFNHNSFVTIYNDKYIMLGGLGNGNGLWYILSGDYNKWDLTKKKKFNLNMCKDSWYGFDSFNNILFDENNNYKFYCRFNPRAGVRKLQLITGTNFPRIKNIKRVLLKLDNDERNIYSQYIFKLEKIYYLITLECQNGGWAQGYTNYFYISNNGLNFKLIKNLGKLGFPVNNSITVAKSRKIYFININEFNGIDENLKGTVSSPVYTERTGSQNPFNGIVIQIILDDLLKNIS